LSAGKKTAQPLLASLPAVDELLKSKDGAQWLAGYPRTLVLKAIRDVLTSRRSKILKGEATDLAIDSLTAEVSLSLEQLSTFSLRPVINATGIVIHTNLGRAILSDAMLANVLTVGRGYSTLEYDIVEGQRGKRHAHIKGLLREITGAEDAIIVNNNAAAVLLCLNTLARGKKVIVSRGELVEIGGSFRVPDVMAAGGVRLHEVGTTNKTHLHDYANAIEEETGLLLKVHQSNYRMIGFTSEVDIRDLVELGRSREIPVMFDLGSGSLIDLRPYGINLEPTVQEIVKTGVDIVTFSGDKLLGGPQGGIIAGKQCYIEQIQRNPLARAMRVDKLTLAAFESCLMEYRDPARAVATIPVLSLLLAPLDDIRRRARRLAVAIRRGLPGEVVDVIKDISMAGGGSLPGVELPTAAVSVRTSRISAAELEERIRKGSPAVIARIRDEALILDARTIRDEEVPVVTKAVVVACRPDMG
jgi:L-seryl-tRNA(Ser) seleniumtransferase